MEQQLLHWINQYGYTGIFVLLMLGIVGLPVPDETLLTFTGYLIFKDHLKLVPAFFAALLGSCCGITLSYLLGRTFGIHLVHKYGRYIHLTEERIQRAHLWFERVGRWSLTIGYFIPGVRHLTAYAAGTSELELHYFALFAYGGALAWTATFITLGYFLGERWESVTAQVHRHVLIVCAVAITLGLIYWLLRRRRAKSR